MCLPKTLFFSVISVPSVAKGFYLYGQKLFDFFFSHSHIQEYRVTVAPASLPATYSAGRG
jgi:hypothetical protein